MTVSLHSSGRINKLQLKNRLILAPMQQHKGTQEGHATDYHVQHYGRRAADVGLVIIESTAVSPEGRLYQDDIGIYSDSHIKPLSEVVKAVHAQDARVFIQLSHGGRKSQPLPSERLLAPSSIAFNAEYGLPFAASEAELALLIDRYRRAALRSQEAGFDGIELHAAHGYLLHQFLSPVANRRTDDYGGTVNNRLLFVLRVVTAVREAVGPDYPVQIRVSASDYDPAGLIPLQVADIVSRLEPLLDAIHVSSGGITPVRPLDVHPGYQIPYAAIVKSKTALPVIAVGGIHQSALAERVVAEQLADFVAIGRPMLEDPDFAGQLLGKKPSSIH
ncbi:oxidoreductase [Paenibacillus radicis (ex Gao et al. 2016)]|uniref:NADPH dehydrogenase n=1 Tax=Paenibacillus radicis (ex Gao et al. 2016) TaxID=1737354 RepID=A0A917H2Q6_9BACL|nr:NADH:flavin oxidoreductase [Paenibacillus radicis (ex Gao et al. 2016)]GGG65656.1 NADPH dehydrogenase [Paenibacillus radicis (ex Gao et al. 2016)]